MSPPDAILIVEDDENLRLALTDNLEAEGYRVEAAATGAGASTKLDEARFDLIILDLMLPDTDGYRLCRELRAAGSTAMILMLTARSLEEDLIRGFDAGADDYLAKPYRLRELLARVQALLRRGGGERPESTSLGVFRIDRLARKVTGADGSVVPLTRTEFDLLALLVKRVDHAISRDEILDAVWGPGVVVDGRTVDNFVSSLKKKLSWSADSGFRIQAVRGVGYRMEID